MEQSTDWLAIATLAAVFLGPVFAVFVTRKIDELRASTQRKEQIFRDLMRTRLMPIHMEHVSALNLIEVEFVKVPPVIAAWKAYMNTLSDRPVNNDDATIADLTKKRSSALTKLISAIADNLKIKIEQLAIHDGNYLPQAWNDDDAEQRHVRRLLIQVLSGQTPLPIQQTAIRTTENPFPPAPIKSIQSNVKGELPLAERPKAIEGGEA